eukprot:6124286-Prymnesium_polylepis.1
MLGDGTFFELPTAAALFSRLAPDFDRAQLVQDALRLGGVAPCGELEADAEQLERMLAQRGIDAVTASPP